MSLHDSPHCEDSFAGPRCRHFRFVDSGGIKDKFPPQRRKHRVLSEKGLRLQSGSEGRGWEVH